MSRKNGVVPSAIVAELLNKQNYTEWRVRIETYLLAEDLLDIVESIDEPPKPEDGGDEAEHKAWRKKNATALHAIQISCSSDAFTVIENIRSARSAWDALSKEFKPQPQTPKTVYSYQEVNLSNEEFGHYEPFYNAVKKGDWRKINNFISRNSEAVRARITYSGRTALHVAAISGQTDIVDKLVNKMLEEDLEIKDMNGFTPLALAATNNAKIEIAKCMVRKNNEVVSIHAEGMIPAALAFRYGHNEMGRYLFSVTPLEDLELPHNGHQGATLMCNAIYMKNYDIALDLLEQCPKLAITLDVSRRPPLYALANLPSAFLSTGSPLKFWQRWIYDCICINQNCAINDIYTEFQNKRDQINYRMDTVSPDKDLHCKFWSLKRLALDFNILGFKSIYEMKLGHVQTRELLGRMCDMTINLDEKQLEDCYIYRSLFLAVDRGNVEFIINILKSNPELMEAYDNSWRNIFMRAIFHRQAKIFSLIHGLNSKLATTTVVDKDGNNMLHMAAMFSPYVLHDTISGAALQMQRELQWFKEVESIVPPWTLGHANSKFMTPNQLFSKEHKELIVEGERWMKETATSCTVVGALIVTIMFAVAFTVPGGNDQNTGLPMFLERKMFMLFIASDAISLFSSTTSVLMFLGILTSRYAEEDFLKSLPRKLIIGLSTLFLSIAAMMIAFCASLFIMLRQKSWIFIPVISLASIPVTLFVLMQFPLLIQIYFSTYGAGIFKRNIVKINSL